MLVANLKTHKMKIAVTISKTEQVSMDEWKDFYYTNVFEDTSTIKEINEWIQTIHKDWKQGILGAKLSMVDFD